AKLRIEGLQADLAKARTAAVLGKFEDSIAGLTKVEDAAKREGYAPLEAEALGELAGVQFTLTSDAKQAEQATVQVELLAERGRDDVMRARTLIALVYYVGILQLRTDEGRKLVEHARAVIKRLASGEQLEARLLGNEASLLAFEGKL